MKKEFLLLTILLCILGLTRLSAQCDNPVQIDVNNQSLENWEETTFYDDPAGDFWDTPNKTADLVFGVGVPPSVTRTTDAHSGMYAAKIETQTWFGQLASGTLFAGFFDSDVVLTDPDSSVKFGKPFTDRPDEFSFWYKYDPVQGDSAEAYVYLTKWNGTSQDTVGAAYTKVYDEVTSYTEMIIPIEYATGETPDSITMVFASSSRGDIFQGQEGNAIFIDDVSLYYCSTNTYQPLMSENPVKVFPNPPSEDIVNFQLTNPIQEGIIRVFSNDGKEIIQRTFNGADYQLITEGWTTGLYRYTIIDAENSITLASGTFSIAK